MTSRILNITRTDGQSASPDRAAMCLRCLWAVLLAFALSLAFGVASTYASKHAVDFIGAATKGEQGGAFKGPESVAVNDTGAGGVPMGTIYVADGGIFSDPSISASRIERFQREDSGTPGETGDDTYRFVSAWGAGVLQPGSNYEICTVASQCRSGEKSGGNGTTAGNGSLYVPSGIAVDQDTGEIYVVDGHARVSVYSAVGEFLRSYGWDVVESGPGDDGTAYEVCRGAVDVCKAGIGGAGMGQIGQRDTGSNIFSAEGVAVSPPDGDSASGTVYVADQYNGRVTTYHLDGSAPSSFGSPAVFPQDPIGGESWPKSIAVDSRGIVYASTRPAATIARYDSQNVNGNGVGFLDPITVSPLAGDTAIRDLAVDPGGDGSGPDSDVLYVSMEGGVQQYGPTNAPGLTVPPSGVDDTHAVGDSFSIERSGLAVEPSTGRLYLRGFISNTANGGGFGIYVLDEAGPPPTASLDSLSDPTSHSVVAHFTIDPNGPPTISYHFEYSSDGTNWKSLPTAVVGTQEDPQSLSATLEPPGGGFLSNSTYQVRLVAGRRLAEPVVTAPLSFTTLAGAPLVETTGSPLRTTTTARLEGRVSPQGSDTTYHFEYGSEGPCDANPCVETEPHSLGSSSFFTLVSQQLEGLEPGRTYHYRVVADNGNPGSPVFGQDMTLSTRAIESPLSHGRFPGPPDSDRAYEQVSLPDTGGNPVTGAESVSDNGERVFYRVSGGTPISNTGTFLSPLFAERTATGWRSENNFPAREQLVANSWLVGGGRTNLADSVSFNFNNVTGAAAVWRVQPGAAPTKIFEAEQEGVLEPPLLVPDDASRVLGIMKGSLDPEHPVSKPENHNLYDITSGSPRLVGLMPDGSVPTCGSRKGGGVDMHYPEAGVERARNWISADGSTAVFPAGCAQNVQLYLRDLTGEQTAAASTPPLSGASCSAAFIRLNSQSLFFSTASRLSAEDSETGSACNTSVDIYRYELNSGERQCLTCLASGLHVAVQTSSARAGEVSADGSRIYFLSGESLIPGGGPGLYRLDVDSGEIVLAVPGIGSPFKFSSDPGSGQGTTHDGSVITFASADPALNSVGGQQNDGTRQYYRYDDRDRSLTCLSCPQDGSQPLADVPFGAIRPYEGGVAAGANKTALSADGQTIAFATSTPLVRADQNTPDQAEALPSATDVYEWRGGRLLLVTDGLTQWPSGSEPFVSALSPSGRDLFFVAATQYTPDALDGYARLYDARIGGGIEFPPPPKPCPLEVCQGTPKGAPEEQAPGTNFFSGAGNATPLPARHGRKHRKKKHPHKGRRHHKKTDQTKGTKQRAKHDRRTAR